MAQTTTLELQDRVEIEDLLTLLCEAVDDGDADGLGACLTEDVSFDVGFGPIHGRDAVVEVFKDRLSKDSHIARHLWSNLHVGAREGDRVAVRHAFATFAVVNPGSDAPVRTWRCGDHLDVFEKGSDGRWLLAERKVGMMVPD